MVPLTDIEREQFKVRNSSAPPEIKLVKINPDEEAERVRQAKELVKKFNKEKEERTKEKEMKEEKKRRKIMEKLTLE